jgi:predicted neutral ceramidase superfamily lipid hydrolase
MSSEHQTAERLARIETNMERIATAVEKALGDHEDRIRKLESLVERLVGVLKVFAWLGAPTTAALFFMLARHGS